MHNIPRDRTIGDPAAMQNRPTLSYITLHSQVGVLKNLLPRSAFLLCISSNEPMMENMETYQRDFVEFTVRQGALRFGTFTLKSGRTSPYFFNSGAFNSGHAVARLGYFYAAAAMGLSERPTVVYGPAYKGIPLAVTTAIALAESFNVDVAYCFDRKEAKTHGDTGLFVGHVPRAEDRILLVDDVITDGATKLEAIARLRAAAPQASLVGLVIALNRQERTADGDDPVAALERMAGLSVRAVVSIREVAAYLRETPVDGRYVINEATWARLQEYFAAYGV